MKIRIRLEIETNGCTAKGSIYKYSKKDSATFYPQSGASFTSDELKFIVDKLDMVENLNMLE